MKVKGWVVVCKRTNKIHRFEDTEYGAKQHKKSCRYYYGETFLIKPCTITIHDKAVGK